MGSTEIQIGTYLLNVRLQKILFATYFVVETENEH